MGETASGALALAGDVIAGGITLAGLILVYLGSVTAGFAGFERTQQGAVRATYRHRAWFAVVGIFLCLGASGSAVIAKWHAESCWAIFGIILLLAALAWAAMAAILSASEVK